MKVKVRDENGKEFEVEEIEEKDEEAAPAEKPAEEKPAPEEVHDDALSPDEISALKELAAMAPKLKALLKVEEEEHAGEPEPETHDEDPADEDTPEEEVVDTCHDSKDGKTLAASAGAVEKRQAKDSIDEIDAAVEIEQAWQKRYNGGAK